MKASLEDSVSPEKKGDMKRKGRTKEKKTKCKASISGQLKIIMNYKKFLKHRL